MNQLSLFDLSSITPAAPPPKIDPYWDEIVLSPGGVDETRQLSLLYDDSTEPPEPDDYPSREAFNKAWDEWEKRNPHLVSEVSAMSDEDENCDKELRIGDRFKYKCSGQLYTLVNIRLGKPKPYTFQADDGSKLSCLHWENMLELAPQQSQQVKTNACDAPNPGYCVGEQVVLATAANTVELSVGEQVTLVTVPDTAKICVGEQVTTDTTKTAPQHDTPTHWVEKYWVERSGNKYWYYRYMYMTGRKLHRIYIGSVNSRAARELKAGVESAMAFGESQSEIEKLIRQKSRI